jgi:predicted transcriptional regulator
MKADRVLDESPREREILDVIYAAGPSSVSEVRERLADAPSYSAVRTMLTRLVGKGYLRYKREGMRYVYSPARQKDSVSRDALRRVLNMYFGGSVAHAVNALLDDRSGAISREEAREIQRRLAAARKAGK